MAQLIPPISSFSREATAGEKRFAQRLRDKLDDEYLCWYNAPVGDRRRYPDFIILHPDRGLLVLEVKDWKPRTITSIKNGRIELKLENGTNVAADNPLEQSRNYAIALAKQLQRDKSLIQGEGKYQGKLVFPWAFGVVLTNITRRQFKKLKLQKLIPHQDVVCRDEMTENCNPYTFEQQLLGIFKHQFLEGLNQDQVDRIRAHIYPEIIIPQQFELFTEDDEFAPDVLKVMSIQQEQFARGLGAGHRIVHGVAGSGKTLILCYRCDFLAKTVAKPILVICYNRLFASRLREYMEDRGWDERKIIVRNFHRWCGEQLDAAGIERGDFRSTPTQLLHEVETGQIPPKQYGAIIVDEGNDFHDPNWLRLLTMMSESVEAPFLFLYDDAQTIYEKGLSFPLSEAGLQARGRTSILRVNYRNTDPVQRFAFKFASSHLSMSEDEEQQHGALDPIGSGRTGIEPHVAIFKDRKTELSRVSYWIKKFCEDEQGRWSDFCITCRYNNQLSEWVEHLRRSGIPAKKYLDNSEKDLFRVKDNVVKLLSMHSCKGLEFPIVFVSGACDLPNPNAPKANEAKLLYVAMTRAKSSLVVTGYRDKGFLKELKALS